MAGSDQPAGQQRPPFQSYESQSSVHFQSQPADDDVTPQGPYAGDRTTTNNPFSSDQDSLISASGHARTVSADSGQWIPMGSTGPSTPSLNGPAATAAGLGSPGFSPPSYGAAYPTAYYGAGAYQYPHDAPYPSPGFSNASTTFSPTQAQFQQNQGQNQNFLLGTPPTPGWSQPRGKPTHRASYISLRPLPKKWYKWRPPYIMYVFFLFGFACAVGHHVFYNALAGRPATDQLTMLRYGTVLAFASKASLAACMITAYRQRIWATVQSKLLSVAAVDSLFAATEDVAALANWEVYRKATIAMILALIAWLMPLVIILTSNTLTVTPAWINVTETCPHVRTLDFTQEGRENWRDPTRFDNGLIGQSVSIWNSTTVNDSMPGWFDYYTAPSDPIKQIALLALYNEGVVYPRNVSNEICGQGWNCTYTIDFVGPGYQCKNVADKVGEKPGKLRDNEAPFDTSLLLPEGEYSYYAHATPGDYSSVQMKDVSPGGMPEEGPPFPKDLGTFRVEPIIWVGYSVRNHPDEPVKTLPKNSTQPGWNDAFTPKMFACEHYETKYTVNFTFEVNQQSTKVVDRKFIRPVLDTTYLPDIKAMDGTEDNVTATPKDRYIYPQTDKKLYRNHAAYYSIGHELRNLINGTINSASPDVPIQNTKAITSKLFDQSKLYFANPNLDVLVQDLYQDILLSLFFKPELVSVVYAADPSIKYYAKTGTEHELQYECTRSRWELQYMYVARDLWIVYTIALLCALGALVLGTIAVLRNEGVLRNTKFSSIVAATRGPALERVVEDDRGHLAPGVRKLKVGYGVVHRQTDSLGSNPTGGLGGFAATANAPGTRDSAASFPERGLWDTGEIRYGFAPEGVVRQMK